MFTNTLENLKTKAIKITDGDQVFLRLKNRTETLSTTWITPAYTERYWCSNEGIVSFIDQKMDWYVIPDIGVQEFLERIGYQKADFYVPLTLIHSYPVKEEAKWAALVEEFKNRQ